MKTVVITGGSKGIGSATCQRFLDDGWRVINLSRSPSSIAGVTQLEVDLAADDGVGSCHDALLGLVRDSDSICLIHNAGLLLKDSARDLDAESFRRALQVNVVAPSQLSRLLLPEMKTGSSIIFVGSTLAEKAVANSCSYVTSKHAMLGLMRATCQDLIGTGVHTASVCPGFTDTEMLRAHVGQDQGILDSLAGGVTFGRLIEPDEIARTIHFCALNPVINGAVIHANLGQIES